MKLTSALLIAILPLSGAFAPSHSRSVVVRETIYSGKPACRSTIHESGFVSH